MRTWLTTTKQFELKCLFEKHLDTYKICISRLRKNRWTHLNLWILSCPCPPSERSRVKHPSGCDASSLQHQDPASTGHRVHLRLHPGPTGCKHTDENTRAAATSCYINFDISASSDSFSASFWKLSFLGKAWKAFETHATRGDESRTDRRRRVFIQQTWACAQKTVFKVSIKRQTHNCRFSRVQNFRE